MSLLPLSFHTLSSGGSFVNFVDPNDVETDAVLSFSWADLRPNSLFRPVIGLHESLNLLTLAKREAFSYKNHVTSSYVRSHRSSSIIEKPLSCIPV